ADSSGQIEGNYIGTDVTGTSAVGNGEAGLVLLHNGEIVGGTAPRAGELISGNGVGLPFGGSTNRQIEGELIRAHYTGTNPLGNGVGILSQDGSSNNVIGGTQTGDGNTIAYNFQGIALFNGGIGNSILGNSIHDNAGGGISLGSGTNNNQAAPVLFA